MGDLDGLHVAAEAWCNESDTGVVADWFCTPIPVLKGRWPVGLCAFGGAERAVNLVGPTQAGELL